MNSRLVGEIRFVFSSSLTLDHHLISLSSFCQVFLIAQPQADYEMDLSWSGEKETYGL